MRLRALAPLSAALIIAGCTGAPADEPAAPPPPPRTAAELTGALLTADDVMGAEKAEPPSVLGACETELGLQPTARAAAAWEFADGRSAIHAVEAHPRPQDVVELIRGSTACLADGRVPATLGPTLGAIEVDAQFSWCFRDQGGYSCGGALAKGDLLLVVAATADEETSAGALVAKLVPTALLGAERVGFRQPADPGQAPAPTSAAEQKSQADLKPVILTAADLAELGEVTLAETSEEPVLAGCVDEPPSGAAWARWDLPNGRVLTHAVEARDDAAEKLVAIKGRMGCLLGEADAQAGPSLGDLGVDQQHSWCATQGGRAVCGFLLARDDLIVTAVAVAESRPAAERIVAEVAPLAVAALDRA